MKNIIKRRYCMVSDFKKVYDLCVRCYTIEGENGIYPSFWEYGQTFGCFDYEHSHRIGLWEDEGRLVALATYEIGLGEAYFTLDPEYSFLAEELIAYAEENLADADGDLSMCVSNGQLALRNAMERRGYKKVCEQPDKVYPLSDGPMPFKLPEGFRFLKNGVEQIDYVKFDTCLHYGFDHDDEPDGDTDFRIHMHVTPHFNPDLPVIVIDEATGEYAAYANAFVVPENRLAYLEPLCTQPKYRKKGLAAAVIAEMIRRVAPYNLEYITGGSNNFYTAIGYKIASYQEVWKKK